MFDFIREACKVTLSHTWPPYSDCEYKLVNTVTHRNYNLPWGKLFYDKHPELNSPIAEEEYAAAIYLYEHNCLSLPKEEQERIRQQFIKEYRAKERNSSSKY